MKQLIAILLLLFSLHGQAPAQLYVAVGTLKVSPGAVLYSTGDVTNTGGGSLVNDGTLSTPGDITNSSSATMSGNGQYTLSGNWTNSADFAAGTSTVTFNGAANSTATSGGDAFFEVKMSKTSTDLLLADAMDVLDTLHFLSNDNKVVLTSHNLTFGTVGGILGYGNDRFIVAGGTGQVRKAGLGTVAFVYPVGYDASTYNPFKISQSATGTVDTFGVRVQENVLEDGLTGTAFTAGVADASWVVTEAVAGGSDLTLTAQWAASDELTGFDRTDSGIARYDGSGWDLTNGLLGNATGGGPYARMRSGVTAVGVFAVGGEALLHRLEVELRAFLQGPFSGGQMGDALRSQSLIPTTEPYTALSGFTHVGRGGGETVDPSVFATTGSDAIVDWVFLELRDAMTPGTVLETRSALIQRDGDIVDVDGTSPVAFLGSADDDYYVTVRHRNHLGVRTAGTLELPLAAPPYDFTTAMGQAYGSNPMANLGGSFGLWAGNTSGDASVKFQGASNDSDTIKNDVLGQPGNFFHLLTYTYSAYALTDANMDGTVKYQGANNDTDLVKNNVLAHPANFFHLLTFTISEQLP
ncbi:MAG: hypothetical protein KDD27_05940 [Saprospiraceae bacterium]|nr:hypothetical protein [Saprospiraceae bacterium]